MNNTAITTDTDTAYEHEEDDQHTLPTNEWIPVTHKTQKRKQSVLVATAPDENPMPVKTLLKNRGEQMIDTKEMLVTPVKIEFLLNEHKTFNLRSEFIKLFHNMHKVDPTLSVLINDSVWYTPEDFPVDDTFMQDFQVTQKNKRRSTQAAIMFVTFGSTSTINSIKYHPNVWSMIQTSNIFMNPDQFDRQETACPGI